MSRQSSFMTGMKPQSVLSAGGHEKNDSMLGETDIEEESRSIEGIETCTRERRQDKNNSS